MEVYDNKDIILNKARKDNSFKDTVIQWGDFKETKRVNLYFEGATFKTRSDFSESDFEELTFINTVFEEDVLFEDSTFKERVDFNTVRFKKNVSFNGSTFEKGISFNEVTAEKIASFDDCYFLAESNFSKSTYLDEVTFRNSRFDGLTFFEGDRENRIFQNSTIIFTGIHFKDPASIRIYFANFEKCCLENTDLTNVRLIDINWPKVPILNNKLLLIFGTRNVIYDEIVNDPINYSMCEKVYRELKYSYESSGAYREGCDFHMGEMEMRRLSLGKFRRVFSILNIYRLTSGYGENYQISIIVLLLFIFLFSSLYLFAGIESTSPVVNKIQYEIGFPISLNFGILISDLFNSVSHCVEVATFVRDKEFVSSFKIGKGIEIIERIIIGIQFALVIVTFRRRFKRS